MKFRTIGNFSNETDKEITIFLEPACEEVVLSPGHTIELLAEEKEEHFPIDISYHTDGMQIYSKNGFPQWLVMFKGKEIIPSYPTRLSEYE